VTLVNQLYTKYSIYRKAAEKERISGKMEAYSHLFEPKESIDSHLFFQAIEEMGVSPSDNILIRLNSRFSSHYEGGLVKFYKDLFTYVDSQNGNILSLSYTFDRSPLMYLSQDNIFHENMPTNTGLANEIFRRMPNVHRSFHPTHSVSAYGKNSQEIVSSHHLDPYAYSKKSPLYYISGKYNGKEIIVGLNHYTINLHFIEDKSESFGFIDNLVASRININGNTSRIPFLVDNPFKKMTCHYHTSLCMDELFKSGVLQQKIVSGISIYVYNAKKHADLLISLREQNICKFKDLKLKTFLLNKIVKPIVLKNYFNLKNGILYPKKVDS